MRWDDRLAVVLLALLGCLTPAPAVQAHDTAAYHSTSWASSPTWQFTPEVPTGYRAAITAGASVWNAIGRSYPFTAVADAPTNYDPSDACNVPASASVTVHYRPTPGALAVAGTCYSGTTIHRGVLVVDSVTPFYTGTGTPAAAQSDLASTAAHEWGHLHGAAHTDDQCQSSLARATMCGGIENGTKYMRTPEPHDIHTFAASYAGTNTYCGYVVYGAIRTAYDGLGGSGGRDGCPTIEEYDVSDDGRRQDMASGSFLWQASAGAHDIRGSIRTAWNSYGGTSFGFPATNESTTPDGIGRYNHIFKPGQAATCSTGGSRSIYWRPELGAHDVRGEIRKKWCALGWELGPGYPIQNEGPTADGIGAYNHFRNFNIGLGCASSNSSIFYRSQTGAHEVHGEIRQRWCAVGWEQGNVGFPTTDELTTASGVGRYNHFAKYSGSTKVHDASIFWSPSTGAWEVYGSFRSKWGGMGYEQSAVGYPISAQASATNPWMGTTGQRQRFQSGEILSTTTYGTHAVYGQIFTRYNADGGVSYYGFPKTDPYQPVGAPAGDRQVDFQNASIRYVAATNSTHICAYPSPCP